jgi:hypothetical protein
MRLEAAKYLYDVQSAANRIQIEGGAGESGRVNLL